MKAIRIHKAGDLDVIQFDTVPAPKPGPDQVVIKPSIAGVNYIDTYFRSGLYPVQFPFTLGQECGGEIGEVGENVKDLKKGDIVIAMTSSSFAERVVADRYRVVKLPEEVDLRSATAILLQGLTAVTLTHASYEVKSGDWVLVHAVSGGVGLVLAQICKALGAHVIGTTSTAEKAKLAKANGAEHVFMYEDDIVARVKELTDGNGVQVVYDSVGKTTFDMNFDLVARLGTIVSFGQSSGMPEPLLLRRLTDKNLKVLRPGVFSYLTTQEEMEHYASILWDFMSKGQIQTNIWREYLLSAEGVQAAQRELTSRATTGKLLLRLWPSKDDE
ncbi:NADPH:quinone reductase [Malassezia pachydermatis]|uniref:Probable quinone oxidoreductase n=1 Tax=Malassezia pachydermatis TaxID=77020 RepID=A0A0M8MJM6_9BASI|nr:nad -binding protein [Malassezia pachydermatis]KOS12888.1 nad -binding protein [Malassezia pachydermatis]